jgi:hypothetical protein
MPSQDNPRTRYQQDAAIVVITFHIADSADLNHTLFGLNIYIDRC